MDPSHAALYSNADIERAAITILQNSFPRGIEPYIDIDIVAEKQPLMDGFVFVPDINMKFGVDATIRNKSNGKFEIVVDDNTNWGRTSFSIAHEIGHVVLHSALYLGCYTAEASIDLSHRIKKNYPRIEREANYFAGAILIPYKTIFDDVSKVYEGILRGYAGDIKWEDVIPMLHAALAKRYRISVQSMVIRLNQLHIDRKLDESVRAHSEFVTPL
jgi:Zn-dependent peptidase ImmA (M78 family)